jgi:hypothetical protein
MAGAPSKYDPKYCLEVDKYIASCKDTTDENGRITVNIPTFEGFIDYLGVGIVEKTLYNWREQFPEFLQSLEKITRTQKVKVLSNGLAGTYNPTIAKLVLSANHGMSEKTQTDITSKGESVNFYLPKRDGMETV